MRIRAARRSCNSNFVEFENEEGLAREATFSYNDTKVAARDTLLVLRSRAAVTLTRPAVRLLFPLDQISSGGVGISGTNPAFRRLAMYSFTATLI